MLVMSHISRLVPKSLEQTKVGDMFTFAWDERLIVRSFNSKNILKKLLIKKEKL